MNQVQTRSQNALLIAVLFALDDQPRKKAKPTPQPDIWTGVPAEIRRKIVQCINDTMPDRTRRRRRILISAPDSDDEEWAGDESTASRSSSSDATSSIQIQQIWSDHLYLPHVSTVEISQCLQLPDQKRTVALQNLAVQMYHQTVRCHEVFSLLDIAGKGCIVVEDLQRAAADIMEDDMLSQSELEEMLDTFCSNSTDGGVLSRDGLIHIARLVNL